MNYIFLDIDGVLNSEKYILKMHKKHGEDKKAIPEEIYNLRFLNEKAFKLLGKVVKQTNANIILSSSWRSAFINNYPSRDNLLAQQFYATLHKYGMTISGITTLKHKDRGLQILEYVNQYLLETDCWIVIDDECSDIIPYIQNNKFIKTDFKTGFMKKHMRQAIKLLNQQLKVKLYDNR